METVSDSGAGSTNPYRPGAGRVPPELAGRDALLREVAATMQQVLDSIGVKSRCAMNSGRLNLVMWFETAHSVR